MTLPSGTRPVSSLFDKTVDEKLQRAKLTVPRTSGRLVRIAGMTIEAVGVLAPVGATCRIEGAQAGENVEAEVVGFNNDILYLMPYGTTDGIAPGAKVTVVSRHGKGRIGEALLGRVIDGLGEPIDGLGPIEYTDTCSLEGFPVNPMERGPIEVPLDTGIKAINNCLTLGRGQRIGLIAGSGVGKSVLLGMLTRNTVADVVVIGLIGERGREVQEFVTKTLGRAGLRKSVVIAAPANQSPVVRLKSAHLTHTIAEYFREQGANVLLLFDSLTRVAHAQREIGLAIGEPPTAKGYPPSVFGLLPNLIERAGVGRHGKGSVTAIYTILAENDDRSDPIVDIARASLDGQVMLSRALADSAHYPAIDLEGSISRVMSSILSPERIKLANKLRRLWTLYQQNADLIQVGAYEEGTNLELDEAIRLRPEIVEFLCQESDACVKESESWKGLEKLLRSAEK